MLSIISYANCSTEGNKNKSFALYIQSEFERVKWFVVQNAFDTEGEFLYTLALITSFNGVPAFTVVEVISLLVESETLITGEESVNATTHCTLCDEFSFAARYRLFGNVGAFNRFINGCLSFDDVRFRFFIVGSLDLSGSRFEFSLGLDVGRNRSRQLSVAWAELLSSKFHQGSSIGSLR